MNCDSSVRGKRLLVLGGTYSTLDVVKYAKELGIYTVVTDYLPEGEAKALADETAMISTTDIDSLEQLVREKRIDGVFTGASEFNISNMITLCERIGLPVYATRKQWSILSNKKKFKDLCTKFGIDVVQEYQIEQQESIVFPVIVKPVDSFSGHGISVCRSKEDLPAALEYAKSNSASGKVIIEKLETGENVELYGMIQDGHVLLTTASDRFTDKRQHGSPVPILFRHPSKHLAECHDSLRSKIEKMFQSLEIRNGLFFIETFYRDGVFRFYEMGFRLNATQEYHLVEHYNGFNPLKMMLRFAVSGNMGPSVAALNKPFSSPACEIVLLLGKGTIASISGMEEVRRLPYIVHVVQFHQVGSIIEGTGTLDQSFARIQMTASDDETMKKQIETIYSTVRVLDESGQSMIVEEVF